MKRCPFCDGSGLDEYGNPCEYCDDGYLDEESPAYKERVSDEMECAAEFAWEERRMRMF